MEITQALTILTPFSVMTTGCLTSWRTVSGLQKLLCDSGYIVSPPHLSAPTLTLLPFLFTDSCDPNPCYHGASCQSKSSTEFTCSCPEPYIGKRCQKGRNLRQLFRSITVISFKVIGAYFCVLLVFMQMALISANFLLITLIIQ